MHGSHRIIFDQSQSPSCVYEPHRKVKTGIPAVCAVDEISLMIKNGQDLTFPGMRIVHGISMSKMTRVCFLKHFSKVSF